MGFEIGLLLTSFQIFTKQAEEMQNIIWQNNNLDFMTFIYQLNIILVPLKHQVDLKYDSFDTLIASI